MAIAYFLICLLLITLGAYSKDFNVVQLFLLSIGIIAILFQKFIHKGKIRDLGFKKCTFQQAAKSVFIPVAVIFIIFLIDFVFGFIRIGSLSSLKSPYARGRIGVSALELVLIVLSSACLTFLASLITEELGFRGYLISRLKKGGTLKALIFSSLLFGLWHLPLSFILFGSGILRSLIYSFNIFLLGILFGYVFLESGSLIPSSLFHGVWNALEYALFGLGNFQELFIGKSRIIFDPEEGLVGSAVLGLFVLFYLLKFRKAQIRGLIK